MSSSRLILLFLGIIFVVIVIVSSTKIATTLRGWFGKYIPVMKTTDLSSSPISPTPTIILTVRNIQTPTATPIPQKPSRFTTTQSAPPQEIPSTGPQDVMWILLAGSMLSGLTLRKLSGFTSSKKS